MSLINSFSSFVGSSSRPMGRWNTYLDSAFPGSTLGCSGAFCLAVSLRMR